MTISSRALNRSTLSRQLLLERAPLLVTEAMQRIVAVQAQEAPSPYLALWNRLLDFDPSHLDAAFADGSVVKANSVRMTLHATTAGDYRSFRQATEPSLRSAKLDGRFLRSGLTVADADALIPDLLAFAAQPRTATECMRWLEERVGAEAKPAAWLGLRQYAPLLRAPTGGPWSFTNRTSYVAPQVTPTLAANDLADTALQTLALRYLGGFGPASVADIAQFALVQRGRVKRALTALANAVTHHTGPKGETLFDLPGATYPDEDTPAPPRLLGMWDNLLLAYWDRSRVIPPAYRSHVIRINGDVLPTLLVDGNVAGVWRLTEGGIEATAFHPLPDDVWTALSAEAHSLQTFLATREPTIYRRFDHWWRKGFPADSRLLSRE